MIEHVLISRATARSGEMRIALLGGTGKEGRGLALRWARAGHTVLVGSRDGERAREYAATLTAMGFGPIEGGDNGWAAEEADVVVVAVPYSAHAELLLALRGSLAGRVVIDVTVPLHPPLVRQVHLPPGHAAALEAQAILGEGTPVVATLHHVSSSQLGDPGNPIDCDVLVCSDHDEARALVIRLVDDLGLRGLDAGPLRNAVALEAMTPVLLHLYRHYGSKTGIRFEGVT
jgi:8-hydroxy-5-deazaflavin:NADPH oxidoreductase